MAEKWITLRFRCPESVALIVASEIKRLRRILETEHDHLALEAMAVLSSQTPEESLR